MAQNTKFIDVTRSFLPVDPNSFPDGLHLGSTEASPETKIPVMAYKGYNFMPTSYGYKSFFGVNRTLGIDAIDARVDKIFIMQNRAYENILVALADTGVWIKKGEEPGAWTHAITYEADPDPSVHYEWTSTIIGNNLYAYQQGRGSFIEFTHHATNGLTVTAKTPDFLNMAGQVGIFKAGGRLGFWDSDDSLSWSNMDDFEDFTPSLQTMAGNMKFLDVQGKIVTIKPHGDGFIIYATKSIIFVRPDIQGAFQWDPSVVLSTVGIQYPRQAVESSPDTVHFVYTSEGLKKIESGRPEVIVPEVTDFLTEYEKPVYLNLLQGRYLFLEMMDQDYVVGKIQLTEEEVEGIEYVFPGSSTSTDDVVITDSDASICPILDGIDSGAVNGGTNVPEPEDKMPGTTLKPQWTCYLSKNGAMSADGITWIADPQPTVDPNGIEKNMCPANPQSVTSLTSDSTNKVAVAGSDAYIDGWTMERFMQVQSAIWKAEDQARSAYIEAVLNREGTGTKETYAMACAAAPMNVHKGLIVRMPKDFSTPRFGFSGCQFWLTRYAVSAVDIKRVKVNTEQCTDMKVNLPLTGFALLVDVEASPTGFVTYPDLAALEATASTYNWGGTKPYHFEETAGVTSAPMMRDGYATASLSGTWKDANGQNVINNIVVLVYRASNPTNVITYDQAVPSPGRPILGEYPAAGRYKKTETMNAYNVGEDVAITPTPESPYCEITGWTYKAKDGTTKTIAAGACTLPESYPNKGGGGKPNAQDEGASPNIDDGTGSLCGNTFEPIVIDGTTIEWPTETVTIPGGSFFLQKGSNAPVYPTMEGALIFDLYLKKWGKMKLRYKQLLDYSPLNSSDNGIIPFNIFGIQGGIIGADGYIKLFDANPSDSYIAYGKVGFYRQGNTSPEEVTVHFRTPSTGVLTVETSLSGKNLSLGLTASESFTDATKVTLYGAYPGAWANIKISGVYDISYMEYRGVISGRR